MAVRAHGSQEPDDLRGSVTRSIGWVVLERWGSRLLQLIVFAMLARLVTPADFGLIALATAIVLVLKVIVESGFAKSLIRLKQLEPKDASTAFWMSTMIAAVIYALLALAAPLVADLFGYPELTALLRVLGLSLPITAMSQTLIAIHEREFGFKVLSIRQLLAALAGAVAAVPVAYLGYGVWALVVQTMVTAVVQAVLLWQTTDWHPRFTFSRQSLARLWPMGVTIMGTELMDALQANVDKLIIGAFFGADVLGYYYLAQRVGTILMELVTTVIARVSLTTFSRVQDDLPRLNRIFRQLTFAAGIVGVPVFALTALFAPQLIPAVFGEGWEPAIPILWGLAAGWGLASVMYFDRPVLLARGEGISALWLAALQNVVGIVLALALVPLGVLGVVISRWARVFTWPVRLWVMRRKIALSVGAYLLQIGRALLAIVPAGVLVGLLQTTSWAHGEWALFNFAVPMALASVISYGAIVWFIAGEENRAALRPLIASARRRLARR